MEVVAVPRVVGDDEETKVPMRLRSAIFKILELHNIKNTIKPEDIEGMEKSGALNELKANDENNRTEIIELIHKVYNTDEYLKRRGLGFRNTKFLSKISKNPLDCRKLSCPSSNQLRKESLETIP